MTKSAAPRGGRSTVRSLALVAAGALLTAALGGAAVLGDVRFGGGRLLHAAMGSDALAAACQAPLERRLAEKGFQPDDVEFGPAPTLGSPWAPERTFGDSFTFRDGAAEVRVDGVVACVVSGASVTVDFRVGSSPHRDA